MQVSSSTWLPWVFFGPLLTAMVAGTLYRLTGAAWLATVAQVALGLTLLAALIAFLGARRARPKAAAPPDDGGSADAPLPPPGERR